MKMLIVGHPKSPKLTFSNFRLNFAVSNVIFIYIIYLDGGIIAINQLVEISIKIKERPLLTLPLFTYTSTVHIATEKVLRNVLTPTEHSFQALQSIKELS